MRFSVWLPVCAIMAAAVLLGGCSKQAPSASDAPPKSVDLGVVELTANTPSRQDLGGGTVCVITAVPLGPAGIELTVVLEQNGKNGPTAHAAPATPDQPQRLALGNIALQFTPHMK
ncbi:MAG: hypothetical protein C5B50_02160 [Verrucomicrobia bacterium]|nr:MAG: hypothetical protein C5B50_02160 [Verrucomicrobiota bacterium]